MDSLFNKITRQMYTVVSGVLLVAATAGCSEDFAGNQLEESAQEVPLQVDTDIKASGEVDTRAVTQSIGIFRQNTNGYTALENIKYNQIDGRAWEADNKANTIYLTDQKALLSAYSPYGKITFSGVNTTLTTQKYDADKVWYHATTGGDVTKNSPKATFKMKPAYARLRLYITRNDYEKTGYISTVSISNAGTSFISVGTLNMKTGEITKAASSPNKWTYNLNTTVVGKTTNTAYDALVIPQNTDVAGGLFIEMTVDGQLASVTIPHIVFQSGVIHRINLQLNKRDRLITLSGIEYEDYKSVEEHNVITKP